RQLGRQADRASTAQGRIRRAEPKALNAREARMAFQKGKSGNPGGVPKGYAEMRAAAREHTAAALKALVDALSDNKLKVAAAKALLDRGWGTPAQAMTGEGGQ